MIIKTKSPYYIYQDYSAAFPIIRFNLTAYIGNKDRTVYTDLGFQDIIKKNPLNLDDTNTMRIDISNFADSFIDTELNDLSEGVVNSESSIWLRLRMYETDTFGFEALAYEDFYLCVRGYSYGSEGYNVQPPASGLMYYGEEIKYSRNSKVILPFMTSESTLTEWNVSSENYSNDYSVIANDESDSQVVYLIIDTANYSGDDYIEVTYNDTLVTTLLLQDEFRHTPKDIVFLNKEGFFNTITFFKESKENLSVTGEEYNGIEQDHQYIDYNKNGRSEFKANTGWIDEENNEIIKQLLLSEKVYHLDNGNLIPLNINTKEIEFKTLVNDKLINYEISFKYSYNEINNR